MSEGLGLVPLSDRQRQEEFQTLLRTQYEQ